MITLDEIQNWINNFNYKQGWTPDKLSGFEMMNYLTEETGEVAQAVRRIEVGRNRPDEPKTDEKAKEKLIEEIGDVVGALVGLANHYDISLDDAFEGYKNKMSKRYSTK